MEKLNETSEKIITERFGKDSLIALATTEEGVPYVRTVDGYYDNRAFYVLTYALSDKMRQIANKMKTVFAEWINNGHNNFEDENTCILRIQLTDGVLFSHGTRYDIDFKE